MSGKPSRIRGTKGLEQAAWSFHLCHWLEMPEPGRMEVPADPSCPGPTEARMLQVPVPVPASSAAGLVFPVGARTHTYTHTCVHTHTRTHAWSHRSTAVRERSWHQYPCRHQQHSHKHEEYRWPHPAPSLLPGED